MDLVDWQQRFERWILTHHAQDDAAHDLSHFRRVWATATQLAAGEEVDRLVLLTACYFHDIVSLPKKSSGAKSILDDGRRENPRHSAVGLC
ncbi:HD domain-containing protein [Klebsiella pneumoniae]|nr:HD domain-containing protein [Klebsiella pneumoniae subsp. pneumoniae]MCY0038447.1 HD domain-containing protein [Klebsiella pneumoniae]